MSATLPSNLSMRGRLAIAGVALASLGLGLTPAAWASTDTTVGVPILKVAATYKGVPYRWGGTTTRGFDCSGYVQFVFHKLGVKLPRTAEEQYQAVRHIKRGQLRVGDLVFFGGPGWVYHVGIYAGHNMFWDAPHTGDRVRLQKIWAGSKVYGRVRGLKVKAVTPSTAPQPDLGGGTPAAAPSPTAVAVAPSASAPTQAPSPAPSPAGSTATSPSAVSSASPPATTSDAATPTASASTSASASASPSATDTAASAVAHIVHA